MLNSAHILLDSCILNNLLSKESDLARKTQDVLRQLFSEKNKFYISHFTKYELLRGATENKRLKCEKLLDNLVSIDTNDARLNRAIRLYSLYKSCGEIRSHLDSISDIDILIGSLIFTDEDTYLLTANCCDFPRPFFLEKHVWNVEYKKNRGQRSFIYYYLLKANLLEFK